VSSGWANVVSSAIAPVLFVLLWAISERKQTAAYVKQRHWMRPVFGIGLVVTLFQTAIAVSQITERNIHQIAEVIQAKQMLPKQIDENTRLDQIEAKGASLVYSYSLTGMTEAEFETLRGSLYAQLVAQTCGQPLMKDLLDDGVSFEHIYHLENGEALDPLKLAPNACRQ
jgi:hypothetical protein